MAQISYGTITITDTTDLEFTIEYARNQSTSTPPAQSSSDWNTTRPAWAQGYYIWQRTRIHKYGTAESEDTFSTAICVSGSTGGTGQSLTATKTQYTHVASNVTITTQNHTSYTWTDNVPEYDSTKPAYWGRITNTYINPAKTEYIVYKDNGITESIGKAVAAEANAATALSVSQHASEDSQGAMAQAASNVSEIKRIWYAQSAATPTPAAPTTGITTTAAHDAWSITKPAPNNDYQYYFYCDQTKTGGGVYSWSEVILDTSNLSQYQIGALTTKVRNYWWDSNGAHIASGTSSGEEITASSPVSDYGYNTLTGLTGISFRYNNAKVVDLNSTTPSLDFYQPPTISGSTVTQGKKTMMLSANALKFYDPTNGTTEQAVLDSNGLLLKEGGIKSGSVNAGNSGFIYLSTKDYGSNLTINGHQASNWREVIGTKFGVDADGNLYASNADISGKIVASDGEIGGFVIDSSSIHTKNVLITSNADNSVGLSSSTFTRTINNISRDGLKLAIGSKFGVKNDGTLYASNADISGKITVGSGSNVYTTDGVNPLEIGGRNLAPISHWYDGSARAVYTSNTVNTYSTTARGFALCHTSDILAPLAPTSAGVGEEIAISFDFKIDSGGDASHAILFYPYQSNGISIADSFTLASDEKTTNWVRVKRITHARNFGDDGTKAIGCIYIYDNTGNNKFSVRNIKIERGNKATDFTPAPEDVQAEIDAKKSVHTLSSNYSSAYSVLLNWAAEGTDAGNWYVASTAGVKVGDTVRIKCTVSDMSNAAVYVVGTVTVVDSATRLHMTSHGLDTTIIDGGNILTNSIGANQIKANSITANKIRIGDFNNYVTVTENDASSLMDELFVIENGWLHKQYDTGNCWLSPVLNNWTTSGEVYRVTGKVKTPSAGRVYIYICGRDANGVSQASATHTTVTTAANTETTINETITITDGIANQPQSNIFVYFYSGSSGSTTQQGYLKDLKVERMAGGSLIVDGAITADKIHANAIDTTKLTVGTQNDVLNSNVLVGGRNLFGYGSQCESLEGFNRAGTWDIRTEDGYVCAHASGALQTTFYLNSKIPFTPKPNEIVTLSCYVKIKNIVYGTTNPMCELYFSGQTIDGSWKATSLQGAYLDGVKVPLASTNVTRFTSYISDTKWHHFAFATKWADANFTGNLSPFIYFRDATGDLYVRNIKYEKGNKATDWSPAPEDVEAFTEAFSSAKQISTYARSFTKANWDSYGASGHSESWSASEYDNSHISVGDIAYINGSVSDKTGWYAAIIGKVTSVTTSAVVMTSIKVAYNSSQAEKYITKINDAGITIHPSGTTNDRIAINASGFEVWKGGTQRAAYGDTIRLKAPGGFPQICVDANEAWFAQASNTYATLNSNGFDIVRSGTSVAFYGDNARIGATTVGNKYVVITNSGLYVRKQVDASTTKDYLTLTDGWCCFGDPAGSRITCNTTGDSPYFYMNAGGKNALYADATGVKVGNYSDSVAANINYSYIKSDGFHLYQANTDVAFFGATARVGVDGGKRFEIRSDGAYIFNPSNVQYGYYGSFIRLGDYNGQNIRIDPTGANAGIKFNSTADTEVARFTPTSIELGKNSSTASIKFCNGRASLTGKDTIITSSLTEYSVTLQNNYPLTSSNQRSTLYLSAGTNANNMATLSLNAQNDGFSSTAGLYASDAYVDLYYRRVVIGDYTISIEVDGEDDRIRMGTHTIPTTTSTSTSSGYYLGLKDNRWRQLYCWSAPNTGSDGKAKDVMGNIEFAKELIMGLEPVEFQWKDSGHIRSHMGFIAQDAAKVGKALGKDLSFYEASYIDESKGDYHGEEVADEKLSWGMMYDELIAPLVKVVQMQQKEIDQLKQDIQNLKNK